jgi:hypothetical protein
MAAALGCRYAVLLQDDDIYTSDPAAWLDRALSCFAADEDLAIVGLNGGFDLVSAPQHADDGMTTAAYREWHDEQGNRFYAIGDYACFRLSNCPPTEDGSREKYVAIVNRSPQVVSIEHALTHGFFPSGFEPYQYDDHWNCLAAWESGSKVLHMPITSKRGNVGQGGMRLYNGVTSETRPAHFCRNHNLLIDRFGEAWSSGGIQARVDAANAGGGDG